MRVHAFTDDALGTDDATALAARLRSGEVSRAELRAAARDRAEAVAELHLLQTPAFDRPGGRGVGAFAGVPTFVKDNTLVAGLPTGYGSAAFTPRVAGHDAPVTKALEAAGLEVLGKSRMPEFGFNVTCEPPGDEPARNPWDPTRSTGASSSGSAGLVAAGVVPLAHANDGAGSIRIPAASCGLVGFKPTPGRLPANEEAKLLPVPIVVDGVVTRSVRDTALLLSAVEDRRPARGLPRIGRVTRPGTDRLRVALLLDGPDRTTEPVTRAAVQGVADLLDDLGHHVSTFSLDVDPRFESDFVLYWASLALVQSTAGRLTLAKDFDASRQDGLTLGLIEHARAHRREIPGAIRRLRGARGLYDRLLQPYDMLLSPVVNGVTPVLGELAPSVPFDTLIAKLQDYVCFTPAQNVARAPSVSLPLATSPEGLPLGVLLSAREGHDRVLLELALELEQARPFARIWD